MTERGGPKVPSALIPMAHRKALPETRLCRQGSEEGGGDWGELPVGTRARCEETPAGALV